MSDSQKNFNPYLKWLGIRSSSPDHYQLLGIERFESDADVIASAADRQMAHVRKYQNGPQAAQSQELLNELAAAKICLLTPDKKLAYDIALSTENVAPTSAGRSRFTILTTATLAISVAVAVIVWVRGQPVRRQTVVPTAANTIPSVASEEPEHELVAAHDEVEGPLTDPEGFSQPTIPQTPVENDEVVAAATDEGPVDTGSGDSVRQDDGPLVEVIDPPEARVDAVRSSTQPPWSQARPDRKPVKKPPKTDVPLHRLWGAIYARNEKAAQRWMDKIHQLLEKSESPSLDGQQALRSELVHRKFVEFWQKYRAGIASLEVGDSIPFLGAQVKLANVAKDSITLETAGGESKSFDTSMPAVDADFAVAVVRSQFSTEEPMMHAMLGVFWATDRLGDRNEAAKHLSVAQINGIPIEFLLPSSPRKPPAQAGAEAGSHDAAPSNPSIAADTSTTPEPIVRSDRRAAVPSEESQKTQMQLVRNAYRTEFSDASSGGRRSLAQKLLKDAHLSNENPPARYVMYRESLRIGIDVGDIATANEAIRAMAYNFVCDETELKSYLLTQIRRRLSVDDRPRYVASCFSEMRRLSQLHEYDQAKKIADLCVPIARSSRDPDLRDQARTERDRLVRLSGQFQRLTPAQSSSLRAGMASDEATNNLPIAIFLVFDKLDFVAAAPYLAATDDSLWASIGQLETQRPSSATNQLELADLWWKAMDHAEVASPDRRNVAKSRAQHWYRIALPQLDGISRQHAATRLASGNST